MKKLISVLLSCLLIFSTFPLTTLADTADIVITSPANGAVLDSLSSVDASVNVAADYVIVRLDGVELGTIVPSEGLISYNLNDSLAIGSHTVDVIAVGEGVSAIASSTFTIKLTYDLSMCSDGLETSPTVPSPMAVNASTTALSYVTSHDGTKALSFEVPNDVNTKCKPFLVIGGALTGPTVIEIDLFLGTSLNMTIETKNQAGGWGSMFRTKVGELLFDRSGWILNRDGVKSDKSYVCNEWCRLKIEADFSTGKGGNFYIGKFGADGTVNYNPIFTNVDLGSEHINLTQVKFEFSSLTYFPQYAQQKIIGIDNVRVTQSKTVTGLSSVTSAGTPVAAGSSTVTLKGASQFKGSDFSPYLSAYADGAELDITYATADGDNLNITFAKPLKAEQNVKIILSDDIKVEATKTLGTTAEFSFSTSAHSERIDSVSYESGGVSIYSPQQIKAGTALDCTFHLSNDSSNSKPVILIAALYKGDEMITFSYVSHTIPAGNSTQAVTLNLPASFNTTDYTIELFSVDSFASSVPLSKKRGIGK